MLRSSVLGIPAFRNLWLGQAISQMGDAFYYVTFMFMVKKITNDNAMVGYMGAVEVLPMLLFSGYAGVLADRIDRRKIMLLSDIVCGVILVALALATMLNKVPPLWLMFVSAFGLSTVRAFFMPAKNAAIPALLAPDQVMPATALSMATQNFMQLMGLAVSAGVLGFLYGLSSTWFFATAVLLDAVSFFGSAYFIAKLPVVKADRSGIVEAHAMTDFIEGLKFVWRRKVLVTLLLVSMLFSLMIAPFFVVYIATNDAWFGGRPQTLAWFEFSFFLGMIAGSAWVGKHAIKRPGIAFIWGLGVVGVGIALMAYSRNFWLYAALNIVCGLAVPFADIPTKTYLQLTVPDAFRGRVNSVLMMLSMGVMPLGMGLAGIIVQKLGLFNTYLVMGIGMGITALLGLLGKEFRESVMPVDSPTDTVPERQLHSPLVYEDPAEEREPA